MKENVIQFQTEIEMHKHVLTIRMEENVLLKNKLADTLKNNYEQSLLEEIEEFQTRFIREDELINSLRKDANDLENLLYGKKSEGGKKEKSFETGIENLRKKIFDSATRFHILKSAFDNFRHKISYPV